MMDLLPVSALESEISSTGLALEEALSDEDDSRAELKLELDDVVMTSLIFSSGNA